ncbi:MULTISPECIES: hypothetical protein [unclassified Streptomyces]|uniref:hypothetical protein n=1 Tax=unclassified Streptomyces TaxID=2593676 RepID=UPI0035D96621
MVRGGRRLLHQRHNLTDANKSEAQWRQEWEAARWFLTAGGEFGKRYGNETIRVTSDGEVSIKLPAPLADLTNSKYGRKKSFRQLISRIPAGKLRALLLSMCAEADIVVVAVDPAYTSLGGAEHSQKPLSTPRRPVSRHQAAGVAIGRRSPGHRVRRRTAPPSHHQSDGVRHRTAQARPGTRRSEGNRPRVPGPRTRSDGAERGRNAVDQNAQDRSGRSAEHVQLMLSL